MIVRRHTAGYNFWGDTQTGITMRWGEAIGENPVYAPWPELADISISNHCTKGCDFCYRDSKNNNSFMPVEQYEKVLEALHSERWGYVFQVALGGGEPLEHPEFCEIINKTHERGIIANFTTNGVHLNENTVRFLKGKVGALAISATNMEEVSPDILPALFESGIKTNIHFILNNESIHYAIKILRGKYNERLKYVNGIIFLTYKPRGRADPGKCLKPDTKMHDFLKLVNNSKCKCSVGFDACFVPPLMKYTDVNVDYIDSCECGFFSVYVDENMNVKPCSFAHNNEYSYNLKEYNMETIWGKKYAEYRKEILRHKCANDCKNKKDCRGKCVYYDDLSFCYVG